MSLLATGQGINMDTGEFAELSAWITEVGLAGQTESAMLTGFCERALAFTFH